MVVGLASLNGTRTVTNTSHSSPPERNLAPTTENRRDTNETESRAPAETQPPERSAAERPLPPQETVSSSSSPSSRDGSVWESCTFRSYRDASAKELPCQASALTNSNGHTAYDVRWADGYRSTYVFWSNGAVEILSKDGQGKADRNLGRFSRRSDGVEVVSSQGSVTVLAGLDPVEN